MKAWKRTAAILLCIAACAGLAGCGLAKETGNLVKDVTETVKRFTEGEEPYYTLDPNLKPLNVEDFDLCEDGKAVLTLEELGEFKTFSTSHLDSQYYGDRYKGKPYDFRGHTIETNRGIKSGSTMQEVVAAYKGHAFVLRTQEDKSIFDVSIEEVAQEAENNEEVVFYSNIYILKGQEILTTAGFHQYIKENHLSGQYVVNHMDEYFEKALSVRFGVKDGIIDGIAIWNEM